MKQRIDIDILQELRDIKLLISLNGKEMFSCEEAAEYMGRSLSYMRERVRRRDIPYYKDPNSRSVRFKRCDLDEWMQYLRIDSQREVEDALARRAVNHKN